MPRPDGRIPYDHSELEELKARVDLVEVFRQGGLEPRKVGLNWLVACPFHKDTEASLSINPQQRLWNCFGCKTGGDVLSFLQLKEGLSFPQAIERLRALAGSPGSGPSPRVVHKVPRDAEERLPGGHTRAGLLDRVVEVYTEGLRSSQGAQEYLASRKLGAPELWRAFRVGAATGTLMQTFAPGSEVHQALTVLGVITATGREHFAGCVVVPLTHPDQGVVGLYGRKIAADASIRHLYLPGPQRGVLNWQVLKSTQVIVVAESVLDALSLWTAGCGEVTCLYGVQGIPRDLHELLGRYAIREVRFCLDADEAGREATTRLGQLLARQDIRWSTILLPEGRDPNQVLVDDGPSALKKLLEHRNAPAEPDEFRPTDVVAALEPERKATGDGFIVRFGDTEYRVAPTPPFHGRLKVVLRVGHLGRAFTDNLDLYAHRARSISVNQTSARLALPKEEVERQFLHVLDEAERWVRENAQEPDEDGLSEEARQKAPDMTGAEKAEALAFLRRADLVDALLADMEAMGYAGEDEGKLLAYLIGVSRKLPRPLSGIVQSQSGAGKSTLTELVETLTPPEEVVGYARLSAQALLYMKKDFLKHRLLILEERVGAEQADYSIRVLQSKQRLSQATVVKDPTTGRMRTRQYEVEGPIAYLETTTSSRINHENATRCFELHLDESEEQTRRIHQRQRETRTEAYIDVEDTEPILRRHHNAQRLLEAVKVVIPYATHLSFPTRWLRTRRDNERFLSLIEASAFFHQHQRDGGTTRSGRKFIRATLGDYRLAYRLAREVLRTTLHELDRDARAVLEATRTMLANPRNGLEDGCFTRRDLRRHAGIQDHRLREALAHLVEMEYVTVVAGGSQGRTYQYRLMPDVPTDTTPLQQLTTPEQLERLLGEEVRMAGPADPGGR